MGKEVAIAMNNLAEHTVREKIVAFEEIVGKQEGAFFGDTPNCPLTHKFADGLYVREMFIPAGTIIVGKIHKHTHPLFLMSGTAEIVSETDGNQKLTGPLSIISPSGTKRAIHAITDVVLINVHHNPTNTQDLEEIERSVIAESYEEYDRYIEDKKILNINS